jgi:PAS domain S-box-containing protein
VALASPAHRGVLTQSANALLEGGTSPAVEGDDDDVSCSRDRPRIRAEIVEQQKLIHDLLATGGAILADRPVASLKETAGEHIETTDPVLRLRVLSGLTSNVSLSAAREIAAKTDSNVADSITLQVALGAAGVLVSILLAWALVATTRRQTAHFRSLVTSSTDLVLVLADGNCRYASSAVERLTGRPYSQLTGKGILEVIHEDDREAFQTARTRQRKGSCSGCAEPGATSRRPRIRATGRARAVELARHHRTSAWPGADEAGAAP